MSYTSANLDRGGQSCINEHASILEYHVYAEPECENLSRTLRKSDMNPFSLNHQNEVKNTKEGV